MKGLFLLAALAATGQVATAEPRTDKERRPFEWHAPAGQVPRRPDGVIPERTPVYKTAAKCEDVKKTKLYFDAPHPFDVIVEQNCGDKTFLVVRWYEKEGATAVTIDTVLKDDVLVSKRENDA